MTCFRPPAIVTGGFVRGLWIVVKTLAAAPCGADVWTFKSGLFCHLPTSSP